MGMSVAPVDAEFLWRVMGMKVDMPVKAYVGVDGDRILGAGGLGWAGGKCWLFLLVLDVNHGHPMQVVRWGRKLLRIAVQLGESEVFTPRDDEYPSSKKLLHLIGFQYYETDEKTGKEIHRWQTPSQSQP